MEKRNNKIWKKILVKTGAATQGLIVTEIWLNLQLYVKNLLP
ncbi:hypothetical protein JSO61_002885 [Riemerella anatipestifer]